MSCGWHPTVGRAQSETFYAPSPAGPGVHTAPLLTARVSWKCGETGREEGTEGMLGGVERFDVFKAEEPENSPIKTLLGRLTRNSQCNDNKM